MKERYYSLDVFRGATVALMILVNNQAGPTYTPLDHASWHGCTPTDIVFPFFLFAVGNAMAFVMPRLQQAGTPAFMTKVIRRTLLIFFIGFFLNWCPFLMWQHDKIVFRPWEWTDSSGVLRGVRILGVLQRIAVCYFFASLIIYFFKPKTVYVLSIIILLLYWLLCWWLGAPGDPYSLSGYFGIGVDKAVLHEPHMYHGEGVAFDPEGITSNLSAIIQVVGGYFVGRYIQKKGKTFEMLSHLFVAGVILVFAGFCWDLAFPINKKIWTSSYVLYTTGLAALTLSTAIYFIEFKNARGVWSRFFDVFGKNPLFIFFLSGFLPRVLGLIRIDTAGGGHTSPFGWFYLTICKPIFSDERAASLTYAVILIIFYWFIVYLLDRKKIYIRV
ncbi:MAG TPA: DUF5009 domain-containing protein [Chitinophagaceae bacterium]|nr:DUF5009 domain-containing protein [Chitinophagaceae bacterium]